MIRINLLLQIGRQVLQMQGKIRTDRQVKIELLCMLFVASIISGMALCHAGHISGVAMYQIIALICIIINIAPLLLSAVLWALRNQINKGIKYALRHYKLILRLRQQLLDADVYTIAKFGATKYAKIPWITVDFSPDYQSGTIYIQNSIRHHDKLSKIDISSSLDGYVIEQIYLSDDENHYRYDFYNASINRKLKFNNLAEVKTYTDSMSRYELFVDKYTVLPLTHQLLVGQTGSGKTYALHGYLLQMLLKPVKYHLYFADPKSSSIALLGEQIAPDNTADDFDGMVKLLEIFVAEMKERQHEMKQHLRKKIDGDYRDFGLSPHILIFDEFADFSLYLQTQDKKTRDHVNSLISSIVLKGRQSGFFVWIVMQQAGSNNIPTYVRDNLPQKIVLGNAEQQTYVTAFGAGVDIPQRKMEIGDGVYTYPAIANKPRLCSFPEFGFDILQILEAGVM